MQQNFRNFASMQVLNFELWLPNCIQLREDDDHKQDHELVSRPREPNHQFSAQRSQQILIIASEFLKITLHVSGCF